VKTKHAEEDREFMLSFNGEYCCIKKYSENPLEIKFGLLLHHTFCNTIDKTTQVLGVLDWGIWQNGIPKLEQLKVLDVDKLLEDGWMVD